METQEHKADTNEARETREHVRNKAHRARENVGYENHAGHEAREAREHQLSKERRTREHVVHVL